MIDNNMELFQGYMDEYRNQLQRGVIQQAYRGLMEYMLALKSHFQHQYPDFTISSSLYYGYMDMTYFAISTRLLNQYKLKIALVFIHAAGRFEAWLSAQNKGIQARYWRSIRESGWNEYKLVPDIRGADSIIEYNIVQEPDFGDLEALTALIESKTLRFIQDIEGYLSQHPG